jgi:peptidoglycan/LPS O-acetylase OafA/YrhL
VERGASVTKLGYRPALDGLRGIAIALVVGFHAFGWPAGGTLGVDLFFVLSGFLITTLLLEEHEATRTISIRNFYARRARRLLPALGAMLAPFVLLALGAAAAGSFQPRILVGLGAALTYTSNIVVAADPSAVPAALVHLWSLAAEEQFYILWPIVLVALLRRGGTRLVLGALALLLALAIAYRLQLVVRGASIDRLYYAPDTHADSLLVGCAFGCCFVRSWLPRRLIASKRTRTGVGAAALVLVAAVALLVDRLPPRIAYGSQLIPTGFALTAGILLVCTVAGASAVSSGLGLRPLVSLGRISYSLYLWHLPVLVAFAGVERRFDLRTVTAVVAAIGAAAASRKFVESPLLRPRPSTERVRAAAAAAAV